MFSKKFPLLLVLVSCTTIGLYAQNKPTFKLRLDAGLEGFALSRNTVDLNGGIQRDTSGSPGLSLSLGGLVELPLGARWHVQSGLLFNLSGFSRTASVVRRDLLAPITIELIQEVETRIRTTNLQLPISLGYRFGKWETRGGLLLNYQMYAKVEETVRFLWQDELTEVSNEYDTRSQSPLDRQLNLSAELGIGYLLSDQLTLGLNYRFPIQENRILQRPGNCGFQIIPCEFIGPEINAGSLLLQLLYTL